MALTKIIDNYIYAFTVPQKKWYIDEVENEENIVSKAESEIRLFKLNLVFSVILLIVCCALSLTIHSAGKKAEFLFYNELSLNEEKMALQTLKIINTYQNYSQRIVLTKNLSLLVLEEENPEFHPSVNFFFPQTYKQFYKISPEKNVKIFNKFYQERILPKTSLRSSMTEDFFDFRSTGVRFGHFFWIFGGSTNCYSFDLGNMTEDFNHKALVMVERLLESLG